MEMSFQCEKRFCFYDILTIVLRIVLALTANLTSGFDNGEAVVIFELKLPHE